MKLYLLTEQRIKLWKMNYATSHFVLFVFTINKGFLGVLKKKKSTTVKHKNWSSLRTP